MVSRSTPAPRRPRFFGGCRTNRIGAPPLEVSGGNTAFHSSIFGHTRCARNGATAAASGSNSGCPRSNQGFQSMSARDDRPRVQLGGHHVVAPAVTEVQEV